MTERLLRLIDRIRRRPIATRLKRVPGMARIYRASRAPIVRERLRFALSSLAGGSRPRRYRLRDGSGAVIVRHGSSDIGILTEVFSQGAYEPPAEVEQALRSLGRPIEIVDLGAHVGMFGIWARSRWPEARVTSVEAEPENAAICEQVIEANDATSDWTLIRGAASNQEGVLRFSAGRSAQSAIDPEEGNVEVPAFDVLPLLARADLVKIDIEGGEWQILGDPRFGQLGARAIALEFHPHLAPGPDARAEAERALDRAGYVNRRLEDLPEGLGLGWAWRS